MPFITSFYILLTALFASLLLIPPISRLAVSMGMLDRPDARKVHVSGTPRLGGVAIFFALILPIIAFCEPSRQLRGFLVGAVIIFITGLYDDLVNIRAREKLAGELCAALAAVVVSDVKLLDLGDLFGTGVIQLGMLAVPFTVLAIVGMTNAVNLLDGLDGLAAGVSTIAAIVIGIIANATGNAGLFCMAMALTGALLGFLKYNTYPARIFMGDSGSLLLGYSLAFLSIMLCTGSASRVVAVTPLIILAVPIVDTFIVIFQRLKRGQHIFAPDNRHIHHHLLGLGFGHKGTVIVIYCLSYLLAIIAFSCYQMPTYVQTGIAAVIIVLLCSLRYFTHGALLKLMPQLRSNQPLSDTQTYRRLAAQSRHRLGMLKFLVAMLLALSFLLPATLVHDVPIIALFLAALTLTLVFLTNSWGNRFLLFILYFDGAFLIFQLENFGRQPIWGDIAPNIISHALCLVMFGICGFELAIRRRTGLLMNSPLDYLLFFIVVSGPLLPGEFTSRYHLLTVAAKSVILFTAYRMILVRHAQRNRKVIVMTLVALLVMAAKGFL